MNTRDKPSSNQNNLTENSVKDNNELSVQSEENKMISRFDEADPLHDRTPAGDRGPEDDEKKKDPAESKTSY